MITKETSSNKQHTRKLTPKSIISLVFIALFSCIIASFPIMYLCGVSAGKNYENKILTDAPKLNELITNYSGFSDQFETHFNDYFPFKSRMLELYSYSEYRLFKKSIIPSTTTVGKNGWLFYESFNTRNAVSGQYMLSQEALETIYNGIMQKYEILNSMNKKYVIYLAAEKQIIYPEYDTLPHAEYTLIDQLRDYLTEKNCPIPFIYSKDYLLKKKTADNQIYFKYDTHWNGLGAHYGYESVMNVIKDMFPEKNIPIASVNNLTTSERSGDLATTIFLSDYLKETIPVVVYEHAPTYVGVNSTVVVSSNVQSDLKVFIYGDSFAQADYWGAPFVQSANQVKILHNSNNFQVLLDNLADSDVVVEECVQRVPTTLGRVFF